MQTLELVKSLRANANEIYRLFKEKIPRWNTDRKHYDKFRYGFVQGDNDGWYKGQTIEIHFGAWCGVYGDSSTYKEISLDGEIFREHFLKYLNDHKESIMMGVSESMRIAAQKLVDKATEELNTELDKLNELTVS